MPSNENVFFLKKKPVNKEQKKKVGDLRRCAYDIATEQTRGARRWRYNGNDGMKRDAENASIHNTPAGALLGKFDADRGDVKLRDAQPTVNWQLHFVRQLLPATVRAVEYFQNYAKSTHVRQLYFG